VLPATSKDPAICIGAGSFNYPGNMLLGDRHEKRTLPLLRNVFLMTSHYRLKGRNNHHPLAENNVCNNRLASSDVMGRERA
jgi:hypothetical protein